MDRSEIINKLRDFVRIDLLHSPTYDIKEDEPLFSNGTIDSFAIAQIGVFIETAFNLYIPDPELTVENMDTVAQIADWILQGDYSA